MITAFFRQGCRGTGHRYERRTVVRMRGMVLRVLAAHVSSQAQAAGSEVSRVALIAITVLAVAAFTVLQVIARSRRPREYGPRDWPW
jgi:hypothetical protein